MPAPGGVRLHSGPSAAEASGLVGAPRWHISDMLAPRDLPDRHLTSSVPDRFRGWMTCSWMLPPSWSGGMFVARSTWWKKGSGVFSLPGN